MGWDIHCFKDFRVKNMKDYTGNWEFEMIQYDNGDYIYPSTIGEIDDFLEKYNLERQWRGLVPPFYEISFEDISQSGAESIANQLTKPEQCLAFINENKIREKILNDRPENYEGMLFVLDNLIRKWSEGYYVIRTY